MKELKKKMSKTDLSLLNLFKEIKRIKNLEQKLSYNNDP